jgi:hypothetical protein
MQNTVFSPKKHVRVKLHGVTPQNTVIFSRPNNLSWVSTLMSLTLFVGGGLVAGGGGGWWCCEVLQTVCRANVAKHHAVSTRCSLTARRTHTSFRIRKPRLGLESLVHDVKPASLFTRVVMVASYLLTPHRIN